MTIDEYLEVGHSRRREAAFEKSDFGVRTEGIFQTSLVRTQVLKMGERMGPGSVLICRLRAAIRRVLPALLVATAGFFSSSTSMAQDIPVVESETPSWVSYTDIPILPSSTQYEFGRPLFWLDNERVAMAGYGALLPFWNIKIEFSEKFFMSDDFNQSYGIWVYDTATAKVSRGFPEHPKGQAVFLDCAENGQLFVSISRIEETSGKKKIVRSKWVGPPGELNERPDFYAKPIGGNEFTVGVQRQGSGCHPVWRENPPQVHGWTALAPGDGILVGKARLLENPNGLSDDQLNSIQNSMDDHIWYNNSLEKYYGTGTGLTNSNLFQVYWVDFEESYFLVLVAPKGGVGYSGGESCVYHYLYSPGQQALPVCQPFHEKYSNGAVSEVLLSAAGLILLGRNNEFLGMDLVREDKEIAVLSTGLIGNGPAVSPDGCRLAVNYKPTLRLGYSTVPRKWLPRVRIYNLCD